MVFYLQNIRIYAVACGGSPEFYQYIASQTFGYYMPLSNIKEVKKVLMDICYREAGLESVRLQKMHSIYLLFSCAFVVQLAYSSNL